VEIEKETKQCNRRRKRCLKPKEKRCHKPTKTIDAHMNDQKVTEVDKQNRKVRQRHRKKTEYDVFESIRRHCRQRRGKEEATTYLEASALFLMFVSP
jgi:hypothetical protein